MKGLELYGLAVAEPSKYIGKKYKVLDGNYAVQDCVFKVFTDAFEKTVFVELIEKPYLAKYETGIELNLFLQSEVEEIK